MPKRTKLLDELVKDANDYVLELLDISIGEVTKQLHAIELAEDTAMDGFPDIRLKYEFALKILKAKSLFHDLAHNNGMITSHLQSKGLLEKLVKDDEEIRNSP